MTIIDLVPHMDAGDRNVWQGDQDERPLTDLGWEQARAQAEALAGEKIDALYTSPALRARQTPISRYAEGWRSVEAAQRVVSWSAKRQCSPYLARPIACQYWPLLASSFCVSLASVSWTEIDASDERAAAPSVCAVGGRCGSSGPVPPIFGVSGL